MYIGDRSKIPNPMKILTLASGPLGVLASKTHFPVSFRRKTG